MTETDTPTGPHPSQGVTVRFGRWRLAIPAAKALSLLGTAGLLAWGVAWNMVRAERESLRAADAALAARMAAAEERLVEQKHQLATEQVVLAEIRAQLARIDARVAEVQVTLMRGSR